MHVNYIRAVPPVLRVGQFHAPTTIEVHDTTGPNWFPLYVKAGEIYSTTVYLRRSELRALRDRLDEIDRSHPEPVMA
jgi:hypothetical protein